MTTKKYEMLSDDTIIHFGIKLHRIRALVDFGAIAVGDLGGYIEKEENLSQVYGDAWVYGNAQVSGDAGIFWITKVGSESGTLTVCKDKAGNLIVTRGCFIGSDSEFISAVEKTHGGKQIEAEYKLLIEFARLRLLGNK